MHTEEVTLHDAKKGQHLCQPIDYYVNQNIFVLRAMNQEKNACIPNMSVSLEIFVIDFYNNLNAHREGYGWVWKLVRISML